MKKQISLIVLIAIITTIVVSVFSFSEEIDNYMDENDDTKWIHSGPFSIDREQYLIGHKIFLIAQGVNPNDKGAIVLVKLNEYETITERAMNQGQGKIIKSYPFNGEKASEFNIYFSPTLSPIAKICSVEDLIGEYEVVFSGTNYKNIKLEILNQYLPGAEPMFEPVC